jgi:cation diffusion facilitator family transporter
MPSIDVSPWQHDHNFAADTSSAERRTRQVIVFSAAMMLVEIIAGHWFHSMALIADGWHMSTHVAAFALSALAYYFGRRHASDAKFTFGTGKIAVLGGFTSAIVLSGIALLIAWESAQRLLTPVAIHFKEAIGIATLGLVTNVICTLILKDDPHHHHHHGHEHDHEPHGDHHHHHDLNLRAAYLHVLADALTSVTAIIALGLGYWFGWVWLDPAMGLVGTVVILSWAYTLLRDTASILVDRIPAHTDLPVVIREGIEGDGDTKITDLHIWQVGAGKFAAIIGVVAHHPRTAAAYRDALKIHEELVHVTVEVQSCAEAAPAPSPN